MASHDPLNPWTYKPWWCQPWSIVLTGLVIVASSWLLLHTVWVSVLVALPIGAWWLLFLVLWPRAMREGNHLVTPGQTPDA
jgi:hypothetical protein